MTDKRHISKVSSERFELAVRGCLAEKLKAGRPFTVNEVIRESSYEDGSAVGAATIYAKTSKNSYVHDRLLRELKAAAQRSQRRLVRTSSELPKVPRGGQDESLERTPALARQLLEQESHLTEREAALAAANLQVARQREELYIALATLNRLGRGTVLPIFRALQELRQGVDSVDTIQKWEAKVTSLEKQCRSAILDL